MTLSSHLCWPKSSRSFLSMRAYRSACLHALYCPHDCTGCASVVLKRGGACTGSGTALISCMRSAHAWTSVRHPSNFHRLKDHFCFKCQNLSNIAIEILNSYSYNKYMKYIKRCYVLMSFCSGVESISTSLLLSSNEFLAASSS